MIAKYVVPHLRWIVFGLLLVFALTMLYRAITAKPKAEARLGRNQAEAAAESGKDAVNTVGAAGDREAASADLTRANDQEIRNAQGADAVVNPAADAAGRASLCRRPSYSNNPQCVQRADPR